MESKDAGTGRRRAYILLGIIGLMEAVAFLLLFLHPTSKPHTPDSTIKTNEPTSSQSR